MLQNGELERERTRADCRMQCIIVHNYVGKVCYCVHVCGYGTHVWNMLSVFWCDVLFELCAGGGGLVGIGHAWYIGD